MRKELKELREQLKVLSTGKGGKGKSTKKRAHKDAGSVRPSGKAAEEEREVRRGFARKQQPPSLSRKSGKGRGHAVPKRSTKPARKEAEEREWKSRSPQKPRPKKGTSLITSQRESRPSKRNQRTGDFKPQIREQGRALQGHGCDNRRCWNCRQRGHLRWQCPHRKNSPSIVHEAIVESRPPRNEPANMRAIGSDAARKPASGHVFAPANDCEARRESSVTAAALGCWYCTAGNVPVSWLPWGNH